MKKNLLGLITLLLCCTLVVGCGEKKEKDTTKDDLSTSISSSISIDEKDASLVCTTDMNYSNYGYTMGAKYVVFADSNNVVKKIVSTEIVESDDSQIITEFEDYLNENYTTASSYGGYTYDVSVSGNRVISNVSINYTEFDMDKYVVDYETMADYVNDSNEFTLESVKKMYEAMGSTCK